MTAPAPRKHQGFKNRSARFAPKAPAKRNDPTLPEQARRLVEAGLSWSAVCRELGISRTTLNWYRRHKWTAPAPRRTLFACPRCGTRAPSPLGHPTCILLGGASTAGDISGNQEAA